ncbi:hypothetical protein LQ564_25185 [Massilia sp. G4R7]|uniref:Uncharacterized protein n=1 Tax=Massilia phyllostachyos TaxID=2898585 RepID=A0ABS8QDF5_9BURK|nr:hypothetical protein [Massilia phyllostachyos]MCD2519603.1 hypothetical protein [Massilia phyllostachyos]
MQGPRFDELFAFLTAAPLSSTDLARLGDWLDNIRDPARLRAAPEFLHSFFDSASAALASWAAAGRLRTFEEAATFAPGAAERVRRVLLAQAAREKLWMAAAHIAFPGIGHLRRDDDGYRWMPVNYETTPAARP